MWSESLVYEPTSRTVARSVLAAKAYCVASDLTDDSQWFTWKSGIRAPVYMDCRVLAGDPGVTALITNAMGSAIRAFYPEAEYVIGVAEAGIIWSALTAGNLGKPHAFVRKQRKSHGRSGWVECSPPTGRRAVLVDDVMASGGSLEQAVKRLRDEKQIITIGIQTIANWGFREMYERFIRLGIPVHSLVSYPQVLGAAMESGLINPTARSELSRFYTNPHEHHWNLSALRKAA